MIDKSIHAEYRTERRSQGRLDMLALLQELIAKFVAELARNVLSSPFPRDTKFKSDSTNFGRVAQTDDSRPSHLNGHHRTLLAPRVEEKTVRMDRYE